MLATHNKAPSVDSITNKIQTIIQQCAMLQNTHTHTKPHTQFALVVLFCFLLSLLFIPVFLSLCHFLSLSMFIGFSFVLPLAALCGTIILTQIVVAFCIAIFSYHMKYVSLSTPDMSRDFVASRQGKNKDRGSSKIEVEVEAKAKTTLDISLLVATTKTRH